MNGKIAYVICMNDGIEEVVIDDDNKAKKRMEDLKKRYFELNKHSFIQRASSTEGKTDTYKYYESLCYWHIHSVPVFN